MDAEILLGINQGWAHPLLDALFSWVSQKAAFSIPLLGVILALLWRQHKGAGLRLWLLLLLVIAIGDGSGNFIKHQTLEYRPCVELADQVRLVHKPFDVGCSRKPHGMPSNHALNFFVTALFVALVLRSWAWGVGLGIIAVLVSVSRIYLGVHFPSQVVAGALVGTILGWGAMLVVTNVPRIRQWLALSVPSILDKAILDKAVSEKQGLHSQEHNDD